MKIIVVSEYSGFVDYFHALSETNSSLIFKQFSEYKNALDIASSHDLLLLDANYFNEFEVKELPSYQVLCINHEHLENIKKYLSQPFDSIVITDEEEHLLENLIKSALVNRKYYSNKILNLIINDFQKFDNDKKKAENLFTKKELETLYYICKGFSNNEISRKMNLSVNTIKSHKKNIFKKANVKSNSELISLSIQNAWVELY